MKTLDINAIISLPLKIKIILLITLSILIFSIGYFFTVKFNLNEYERMKQKEISLMNLLSEKQTALRKFKDEQGNLKEIANTPSSLHLLSSPIQLTQLLADLIHFSQSNQLSVQKIEPEPVITKDNFLLQSVHVVLLGSYFQLNNWLNDLYSLPLIISVKQFSINVVNQENEDNLILDAVIDVYKKTPE